MRFLLTGRCNRTGEGYAVFQNLTRIGNGQIFNLRVDDIANVLSNIAQQTMGKRVLLSSDDFNNTRQYIDIHIDDTVKEFNIIATGDNVTIDVFNPRNESDRNVSQILNLDNVKSIRAISPATGVWRIKTSADSFSSIRTTAVSEVAFSYGFSIHQPNELGETTTKPFLGKLFQINELKRLTFYHIDL